MSLLREIQKSLMEGMALGPALLKLRYLSSRLGSAPLEEWVRHESEGYPMSQSVPDYRKVRVHYTGTFSDIVKQYPNAPIPDYIVQKEAGSEWLSNDVRTSISGIDALMASDTGDGQFEMTGTANLAALLQYKVFEGMGCISVRGITPKVSIGEIQNKVRNRIMELTIQLEKEVPAAAEIVLAVPTPQPKTMGAKVTNVFNQTIQGNVHGSVSAGDNANIQVNVGQHNVSDLIRALSDSGIAAEDAAKLAAIMEAEDGGTKDQPFGPRALEWVGCNAGKALTGAWKIGSGAAQKVLTEAALQYYGLK
jgi:hypothetical protein